ncbi:MAG: esterase family protein [Chloroflexi bacterium]|nr:esterase family protein [Chloroflexota bacterium]
MEKLFEYKISLLVYLVSVLISACTTQSTRIPIETVYIPPSSATQQATPTALPTFTSTPAPSAPPTQTSTQLACWQEGGQIEEQNITSDLLPQRLDFLIYLPPCYQQQAERHYPVLYLIHGQRFTHDQWDRLGADELADTLISSGELAPFIIVMPRDRIWEEPDVDMFGEAVIADLIPWVDQEYRTLADRDFRAIGGLSRGAAWAVHLGLGSWELFSAVGAHSLPLFWSDVPLLPGWLEEIPPESLPRIFVDVGDHDQEAIRNSTTWFGDFLNENNIPHEWYLFTGYHEEDYWSSHLEQYLRFYAAEW